VTAGHPNWRVVLMIRLVRRLFQLYLGLICYGVSMDLMVRARLGLDGWDVLHQGLSRLTGLSMGLITIAVGAAVLVGWIPLRQRSGFGTVSNVVVVGLAFDAALPLIAAPHEMAWRIACLAGGITLCGVATGLYISVGWGAGPRDGLMTGLARRTGWSLRATRTGLELIVLTIGWLMGGTVGVGTVAFALCIGPLSQLFLGVFRERARPARTEAQAEATAPA
jgi:uncharacterized membrane protein YczE